MKILVASCDKDEDLFLPFHHCIEKYWPDHPEIIYSTETIVNPYYKTICKNYDLQHWTTRLRETVEEIDDDYILLMCSDIFLMKDVDNDKVNNLLNYFDENTASFNLHGSVDKNDILIDDNIKERSENGTYKTSVMCSLWAKDKFLDVFDWDADPWRFEIKNIHKGYRYLILDKNLILDWGRHKGGDLFGVYRGKWVNQAVEFLNSEGLEIDYERRGYHGK